MEGPGAGPAQWCTEDACSLSHEHFVGDGDQGARHSLLGFLQLDLGRSGLAFISKRPEVMPDVFDGRIGNHLTRIHRHDLGEGLPLGGAPLGNGERVPGSTHGSRVIVFVCLDLALLSGFRMSHFTLPRLVQEKAVQVWSSTNGGILLVDGVADDAAVGFKGQLALHHRVDFLLSESGATVCRN